MKSDQELILSRIERKIEKQSCLLCDKLDQVIVASGGTPVLYNTPDLVTYDNGDAPYTVNGEGIHSISISVIGAVGDTTDFALGGNSITLPAGYSNTWTASTVFQEGYFKGVMTGGASIIISTINQTP